MVDCSWFIQLILLLLFVILDEYILSCYSTITESNCCVFLFPSISFVILSCSPDCTVSDNSRLCQGQTIPGMAIIRGRKAVSSGQGAKLSNLVVIPLQFLLVKIILLVLHLSMRLCLNLIVEFHPSFRTQWRLRLKT